MFLGNSSASLCMCRLKPEFLMNYTFFCVEVVMMIIIFLSFQLPCCNKTKAYNGICPSCPTCFNYLKDHGLGTLKNAVGGIGLFFSLMMVSLFGSIL